MVTLKPKEIKEFLAWCLGLEAKELRIERPSWLKGAKREVMDGIVYHHPKYGDLIYSLWRSRFENRFNTKITAPVGIKTEYPAVRYEEWSKDVPMPSTFELHWTHCIGASDWHFTTLEELSPRMRDDRWKLLITGSRKASPEMLDYARRIVEWCKEKNFLIIVGEAEGVDSAVLQHCMKIDHRFECYGIAAEPRNPIGEANYFRVKGDYLARDRRMVERADQVVAIWNKVSRGTQYTFNYAYSMGRKVTIKEFEYHAD
jgi:hypothetical protein